MNFLSLFSGIGGFDLGLERAGMKCVGQVEIDKKCQMVLAKHWPDVKRIGDIRDVRGDEFGTVDLICGGFPCQPFSTAGKRKGKEDDRYLWPEMLRVIKTVKPAWVIGENVAGIISMELEHMPFKVESRAITRSNGIDIFDSILSRQEIMLLDRICKDIEEINFEVQPLIIPACAVDAPHIRKRVWILAYSEGNRQQKFSLSIQSRRSQQTASDTYGTSENVSDTNRAGRKEQRGGAVSI